MMIHLIPRFLTLNLSEFCTTATGVAELQKSSMPSSRKDADAHLNRDVQKLPPFQLLIFR